MQLLSCLMTSMHNSVLQNELCSYLQPHVSMMMECCAMCIQQACILLSGSFSSLQPARTLLGRCRYRHSIDARSRASTWPCRNERSAAAGTLAPTHTVCIDD